MYYIKHLCVTIIISLFFFKAAAQPIVLINKDIGKSIQYKFYYADDSGGDGHPILGIKTKATIAVDKPVLLIEADNLQTYYLVYPGDTLLLQKNSNYETIVKRENKKYTVSQNNEFLFFSTLIKTIGNLRVLKCPDEFKLKSLKEREAKINKLYKDRIAFLESYQAQHPISAQFEKFCRSMFSGIHVAEYR